MNDTTMCNLAVHLGSEQALPMHELRPEGRSKEGTHPSAIPLAGVTVIELASFVAGPLAGLTLGELGADVVRIDPPGGGPDRDRWPISSTGRSMYWAGLNQGKRSVTVDWRRSEGAELVARLIERSGSGGGIVVTNVRGRGPLAFDSLARRRTDLIHLQVQGRSDGSPAVDYTVNAAVGFPEVTGPRDAGPVNHVLPAWDIACGLYAASAISAALYRRSIDPSPQQITIALEDVALAVTAHLGVLAEAELNPEPRQAIGNALYGGFGRDFLSSDGARFMVVALTPRQWCDLLGSTGLGPVVGALESEANTDFSQESNRYLWRDRLYSLFEPWFEERSADEIRSILGASSVLWSEYATFKDVVAHDGKRLSENPVFSRVYVPGIGEHWAAGSPTKWDGAHSSARPAPDLGADTSALLKEWLDLSDREIAELRTLGLIGGNECSVEREGTGSKE